MWQNFPEQAITVELFAGKDAICIAAIGATPRRHSMGPGRQLGKDLRAGLQPHNSPFCTWIDADHSNGLKAGRTAIYWPGFTTTVLPVDGGVAECGTSFGAWDKEGGKLVISTTTDKQHQAANGNASTRRGPNNDRRLVVSSLPAHSAEELCRHSMSRGPNFVSLTEGTHCNMDTREVLPLCTDGLTMGYFDLEAETAVEHTASTGGGGVDSLNASRVIY